MSASQAPRNKVLADVTKLTVSAAVAGLVLYNHDAPTILYVLASLVNSASAKVLKLLIKQPRPDGAQKGDPGMPSSHATSLSFLSLALFGYIGLYAHSALKTAGAAVVVLLSVLASYWRVSAGYHTVPQVVVGWLVGSLNAVAFIVTLPWTLPFLELLIRGNALIVTVLMLLVAAVFIVGPDIVRTASEEA